MNTSHTEAIATRLSNVELKRGPLPSEETEQKIAHHGAPDPLVGLVDPFSGRSSIMRAHGRLLVRFAKLEVKERFDYLLDGTPSDVDPTAELHARLLDVPYLALLFVSPTTGGMMNVDRLADSLLTGEMKEEEDGGLSERYAELSSHARARLTPKAVEVLIGKVKMLCGVASWNDATHVTTVYHVLLLILTSHLHVLRWISSVIACGLTTTDDWVAAVGPTLGAAIAKHPRAAMQALEQARENMRENMESFSAGDDALAIILGIDCPKHTHTN